MKWCDCLAIGLALLGVAVASAAGGEQGPPTGAFTFVQVCDPQFGWGYGYENDVNSFRQAVTHINGLKPDLVVICGDMANSYNDSTVADFRAVRSGLTMPSYIAPGNHDLGDTVTVARLESYRQAIGPDYFSVEHKGYTFVVVDTCLWKTPVAGESEKQDAWLKQTLTAAHDKKSPIFIVMHHPLYLTSPDEAEEYFNLPPAKRSELLALFVDSGVIAILGGHRHLVILNEYKGIPIVHGETTCRHFDNSPLGFRLWHVDSPTSFRHEYRPLVPKTPSVDFNEDGVVDKTDVGILIDHWLQDYARCDVAPPPFGDGIVDVQDLVFLSEHLFEDYRFTAHWKLDEAEGDRALDSTAGHDGILHGSPLWQPAGGHVAGALQFDGLDDYVSTPFVLSPAVAPFSVFVWVKGGRPGQVVLAQTSAALGALWLYADSSGGNLATDLRGNNRGSRPLTSQTTITDGAWHHIGFTWDGSDRVLCVDDVEVARDTHAGLAPAIGGLHIGADNALSPGGFWSGLIDDVRIYNRAVKP